MENAGEGEGLEAWKALHNRFDVQTRQSRVSQLIQLLDSSFSEDNMLNDLEKFERNWQRWESLAKKTSWEELANDLRIGVVLKGLPAGMVKQQLLLESEKCESFEKFRSQLESVTRASSSGAYSSVDQLQAQLEALKGKGKGKFGSHNRSASVPNKCGNCGKPGHTKKECWREGGGAHKPSK